MIKMCHNARLGVVHTLSPVCKHISCIVDLICGQSLFLLCEPIKEAFFVLSSCEPMMICAHKCKFVVVGWSDWNQMMC
jgi:hypothetical protein